MRTEVCKVHYPIHLFTFVIVGGVMPDPPGVVQGTLTGGVDNITGGVQPPNPPTILTLSMTKQI